MSQMHDIYHNFTELTDGRYEVISPYLSAYKPITIRCIEHDYIIELPQAERLYHIAISENRRTKKCPECDKILRGLRRKNKPTEVVKCAYCGKDIIRTVGWNKNNKTNLAFCSRSCKDLAQRRGTGVEELFRVQYRTHCEHIDESSDYRRSAFLSYPHRCAICGYDEFEEGLEVHHVDEDRSNNDVSNLVILCATCHKIVSLHRKQLIKGVDSFYWKDFDPDSKPRYHRKTVTDTTRRLTGTPIRCIEDNLEFKSIQQAAEYYGVSNSSISYHLHRGNGYVDLISKTFEKLPDPRFT